MSTFPLGTAVKPAAHVRQLSWLAVIVPLTVAFVIVLVQTRQFVSVLHLLQSLVRPYRFAISYPQKLKKHDVYCNPDGSEFATIRY